MIIMWRGWPFNQESEKTHWVRCLIFKHLLTDSKGEYRETNRKCDGICKIMSMVNDLILSICFHINKINLWDKYDVGFLVYLELNR